MAFIDPSSNPLGAVPGVGTDSTGLDPVVSTLPQTVAAFQRRYTPTDVAAMRSSFGDSTVNSFLKFERKRVLAGNYPLTAESALKVLQTASSNKAATPPPKRDPLDILGNAAKDVTDIVTSIPKIPGQILHDVEDLPNINQRIQEGGGGIEGLLQAPIVRLLPGAYTAHNLLTGDFNEALSHPVMTALDVLPYAKEVGLGAMVGKLPAGAGVDVAERIARVSDAFDRTTVGQFAKNAWGKDTRGLTSTLMENANEMANRANPALASTYEDGLSKLLQANTTAGHEIDKAFTDPVRRAEVVQGFRTGTIDNLNLSDGELAAVDRARASFHSLEQFGLDSGELVKRMWGDTTETFDTKTAAKLDRLHTKFNQRDALTSLRESILAPEHADLEAVYGKVREQLGRADTNMAQKRRVAQGYVHALDAAGYDTGSMLDDISKARKSTIGDIVARPLDEIGQRPEGQLRTRRKTGNPALDSANRWLEEHRNHTTKRLDTERTKMQGAESRILPARWQPIFQQLKVDKVRGAMEEKLPPGDPRLVAALDASHQHLYDGIIDKSEMRKIDQQIFVEIQKLRGNGVNPEWFHNVSAEQAARMGSPTLSTMVPQPSQYAGRLNDWTPTVDSFSVSINHAGLELVKREMAQQSIQEIRGAYTTSYKDVVNELRPAAERAAARRGTTVGAEIERLARKEYVRWSETESGFVAGKAKPFKFTESQWAPDELLLPRHLAKALEQIASPPTYSRMFDPVTRVFRVSVLPFSPRFHVNNIAGGMIMLALEDPRALLKVREGMAFSKELYDMNKALKEGRDFSLSDTSQKIVDSMPKELRAQLNTLQYAYAPDAEFRIKAGGKLGEMAQKAGSARVGNAIDWSFQMNELVDNGYRMAAYLSDYDHALKKGLTAEEAASRGVALANKVMPRWLEMTPFERSAMRVVFPFYAFVSHLFRFAARYPIDHPWRTAVMANIARTEISDFGTGLPQSLASAFFLGSPNKEGKQNIVDIGAANPFRDFGDNLTIAGFLGQTNPIFKTALRAIGYDPQSRGPNLYPELDYDPRTGRMVARQANAPGLVGGLVTDIIPQANILAALTGTSSNFKDMVRSNPEAASRMLMSQVGVPLLWRNVDLPQSAFKDELVRQDEQKKVLSRALKSGDYSQVKRWPGLTSSVDALQQLQQSGKLAPFSPEGQAVQQEVKLS